MALNDFINVLFIFASLFFIFAYILKFFVINQLFAFVEGTKDPPGGDENEIITMTRIDMQRMINEQVQLALAKTSTGLPNPEINVNSGSNVVLPDAGQNNGTVAHIGFKAPQPLHLQNPVVWFAILEQQFEIARIVQEQTKFSHAVSSLDARLHNTFADLIIRDKGATPYTTYKNEVIKFLGESEKTKLHNLLHGLTLGDQKPSQLLTKFKTNAGNNFNEASLKQLWMSRLPQQVQIVLTPFENDLPLATLAERADNIMETMSQCSVNSVGQTTSASYSNYNSRASSDSVESNFDSKLASMKKEILNEISAIMNKHTGVRKNDRSNSRSRTSPRDRSPSNDRNKKSDVCFYHRKFNDKAQKCVSSCKRHKEFLSEQRSAKNE